MATPPEIDCLPVDVLHEIFLVHRAAWQLSPLDQRRNSWIPGVAHVCRRWRNVALNSSILWTDIALFSPTAVATFLERSRQAPLSVRGVLSNLVDLAPMQEMLKNVFDRAQQVRTLELACYDGYLSMLPTSKPIFAQLKSLTLVKNPPIEENVLPPFAASSKHFPSLRELSITLYPFELSKILFSSTLRKLRFDTMLQSETSWFGVLKALEGMPLLEEVTFIGDLAGVNPRDGPISLSLPSVNTLVALPHLREFTLRCQALSCATLLNHLVLPANVSHHFILNNDFWATMEEEWVDNGGEEILDVLVPIVMRAFYGTKQEAGPRQITGVVLKLRQEEDDVPVINCQTSPDMPEHTPRLLLEQPRAALRVGLESFVDRAVMEILVPALPLHNVEFLWLGGRAEETEDLMQDLPLWTNFFERLPRLRKLHITRSAAELLPHILRHRPAPDTEVAEDRGALIPHLVELSIAEDVGEYEEWDGGDWHSNGWISSLVEALQERYCTTDAERLQKLCFSFTNCPTVDRNVVNADILKGCAEVVEVEF